MVSTTLKPAGVVPKNEQQRRMEPGEKYLVKICQDNRTHRVVYGIIQIFANCDKNTRDLKLGQQVDLMVHPMNKKEFKRSVGTLYRKRMIELKDNGVGLLK